MQVNLCVLFAQPNVYFKLLMLHLDGVAEHYHHPPTTTKPGTSQKRQDLLNTKSSFQPALLFAGKFITLFYHLFYN